MKTIRLFLFSVIFVTLTVAFANMKPPSTPAVVQMSHVEAAQSPEKVETDNLPAQPENPPTEAVVQPNKAESAPVPTPEPPKPREPCDYINDYDWDVRLMRAIAMAESGCRADAKGDTTLVYSANGREYGYSVGMFQVRILPGREHCDSFDPAQNVACAYRIYKGQGLSAWSVYTNGKYKRYY